MFPPLQELDQQNKEPVPVFIIGNKSDLQRQREVTPEMGEKVLFTNLCNFHLFRARTRD